MPQDVDALAPSEEKEGDSRICRFCLASEEGDSEDLLCGICDCSGTQAFVHLACLRSWQRSCILSSSARRDQDANICPVCKATYSVEPLSRIDILEERVGKAFTNHIARGQLLIASRQLSRETPRRGTMPFALYAYIQLKRSHWRRSVYFILRAPSHRRGRNETDEVIAINLTRLTANEDGTQDSDISTFVHTKTPEAVQAAQRDERNSPLNILHFTGGPVGWATKLFAVVTVDSASDALTEARALQRSAQGHEADLIPERVWIYGDSQARRGVVIVGALNDVLSVARREAARTVTLSEALAAEPGKITVKTFSGCASWSYAQLLGECERGSWLVSPRTDAANSAMALTSNPALFWPLLQRSGVAPQNQTASC